MKLPGSFGPVPCFLTKSEAKYKESVLTLQSSMTHLGMLQHNKACIPLQHGSYQVPACTRTKVAHVLGGHDSHDAALNCSVHTAFNTGPLQRWLQPSDTFIKEYDSIQLNLISSEMQ